MNPLWQRRLHRSARVSGWAAGICVIVLAVLMALVQLLVPLLGRHPQWVAAQLSQLAKRPISFNSLQGRWSGAGPVFVMRGVNIGSPADMSLKALQVPQAELKIDLGSWLLPSRHLVNLHVHNLQMDLLHDANGWRVNGIETNTQQPLSLGPISVDLWLENFRIQVSDELQGKQYSLLAPQLRLTRQGHQIRFGGSLQRDGVGTAVRTIGRFREDGRAGEIWLGAEHVALQPLLDGVDMAGYEAGDGSGHLSVWLNWRKGQLTRSLARLDLDTLAITSPQGATAKVTGLHGLIGLSQSVDGYQLRWAGDDHSALLLDIDHPDKPQMRVAVAARDLQVAPLLPWLALKPRLAPGLANWLGSGQPHGDLEHVALQWNRAVGLQRVTVAFKDLGISPVGKLPGLTKLQGELRGDAQAVSLELPEQATTLQFPNLFRQPLVMAKLAGTLAFWPQDGDWHIGMDTLHFTGAGYTGQARGQMILPAQGGHPFLELYASLDHSDVPAAKLFWPIHAMSSGTMGWLDRALVAGSLDQAQVLVRGDLGDWPFRHNEGRFEARAEISRLTFDYGKEWPQANDLDVVANFINNGMLIEVHGGQSLGVKLDNAVALIPDFGDSLLDLNVSGNGSGEELMNFVRNSPVGIHQADTLAKLKLGGSGNFDLHLSLPLKDKQDMQLTGTAQLKDADLTAAAWNIQLDKLNGPMSFDAHGLQAGPLQGGMRGQPATVTMAIAGANTDPATVFSAQLQGNYRVDELLQDYPSLQWLGQLADGRSPFTIGFDIAHVAGSDALTQTLNVDSPLSGIALDLPIPLHKEAESSLPLHLWMNLPLAGSDLEVALGKVMRGHFRFASDPQQPLTGTLAFGDQMPEQLPAKGLRIRGNADQLDVTGWVQYAAASASGNGSGPGLESVEVHADRAIWFGSSLGAMAIQATTQPDGLRANVDGAAMLGSFDVPAQELRRRGITARLKRLYWPQKAEAKADKTDDVKLLPDPANTGVTPSSLPPLHMWVSDLRMGDSRFGEARLESWPTANGMRIEQLRALSKQVQISASGDWNGSATNSQSHMKVSFAADDLGAMLKAFGYNGLVNGGKTDDYLDASWPGSPSDYSLANMDGTLSIKVRDGQIPEAASPGVGRLLGLVSLSELPRRLSLDFGDVFGKGLAFDSIDGDFKLANGNAITDNLVIKGPAADITLTGRTGLRTRDSDQQMIVVPHIGNSLPLVGAVVAGPVGAAAGFAVQGLLGKGINQAISARYSITGSWDKPVITLIEKHGATSPPPPAPLLDPSAVQPAAARSVNVPVSPALAPIAPAAASSAAPAVSSSVPR